MGTSTPAWDLYIPIGSDKVRPTSNDFGLMQGSTDAALTRLKANLTQYTDGVTSSTLNAVSRTPTSIRPAAYVHRGVEKNQAVRIAVMGDSKAEGAGASAVGKRWQDVLRDTLRGRLFGAEGDQGFGYVPARYGFDAPNHPTVTGVENVDWAVVNTAGLGQRALRLKTVDTTVTYQRMTARYLRVHWTSGGDATGTFQLIVDGDVLATISGMDSRPDYSAAWNIYDLGSVRDVVVELKATVADAQVEGVSFATSRTGVTVIDAAHTGWRADLYDSYDGSELNVQAISHYDPHLIIIALGANDMSGNWGVPIPAADWAQSLYSLCMKLTAACPNAGIIVLHSAMRAEDARSATDADYQAKLGEFEQAARNRIGQLENVALLYESSLWQPLNRQVANPADPVEQDPTRWLADSLHPSDYGHAVIGGYLSNQVSATLRGDILDGGVL